MPATIYKVISSINCAKKFTWTLTLAFEKTLWREYYAAAAAAKSLQSCPTLCDPIDGSPPGCPWDCPGKNTRVSCHFLLQCMKVKSERAVAQSCPTLSDLMDGSLPGSSVHGIFQARLLEWGAIAFSNIYTAFDKIRISNFKTSI